MDPDIAAAATALAKFIMLRFGLYWSKVGTGVLRRFYYFASTSFRRQSLHYRQSLGIRELLATVRVSPFYRIVFRIGGVRDHA